MVGRLQRSADSPDCYIRYKGKSLHLGNNPLRKNFTPIPGADCLFSLYNKNGSTELALVRIMGNSDRRRSLYNVVPPEVFKPLIQKKNISLIIEDYPEGIGQRYNIPSLSAKDLSEIGGGTRSLDWTKIRSKAIKKYSQHHSFRALLEENDLNVLVLPFNCGGKSLWNNINKSQFLSRGKCCEELNSVWVVHPTRTGSNAENFNLINKNFEFCRTINPLVKEITTTEESLTLLDYRNGVQLAGNKAQFAIVEYTYADEIPNGGDLNTQPPISPLYIRDTLTPAEDLPQKPLLDQRHNCSVKVALLSPSQDPTMRSDAEATLKNLVNNSNGNILIHTSDGTRVENFTFTLRTRLRQKNSRKQSCHKACRCWQWERKISFR